MKWSFSHPLKFLTAEGNLDCAERKALTAARGRHVGAVLGLIGTVLGALALRRRTGPGVG
ncbi:MAG: hypothetical protein ACT4NY_17655 [Pseudonocardiales bacterium]